jgi:hypothetical protein
VTAQEKSERVAAEHASRDTDAKVSEALAETGQPAR